MDDPYRFVCHDDDFQEAGGTVGSDDEQACLSVVFLFDDADRVLCSVEHVFVGNAVFAGAVPYLHVVNDTFTRWGCQVLVYKKDE